MSNKQERESRCVFDTRPLLSVILPLSGSAENLRDAVNSVLVQSYGHIEVIICADASVDQQTQKLLNMYGSRLRFLFFDRELTQAQLISKGAAQAKGTLLSWITKDQAWPVQLMESMAVALDQAENAPEAVVCCAAPYIDIIQKCCTSTLAYLCANVETSCKTPICLTTMSAYKKVGGVCEQINVAVHYDYWLRLVANHVSMAYLPSPNSGRFESKMDSKGRWEQDYIQSCWMMKLSPKEFLSYLKETKQSIDKYLARCIKHDFPCSYGVALQLAVDAERDESIVLRSFSRQLALSKKKSVHLDALPGFLQSPKPKIAFYVNVWRFGGIERVISLLLRFLDKYSFVLITSEDTDMEKAGGFAIPEDIMHLVIKRREESATVHQLVHICAGLGVELFVGTPNIIECFLPIYERMKYMHIRTIASHHYYYYLPYLVSWPWLNRIAEIRNEMISYADLVTWPLEFSACCGLEFHPNTIALPNPNTFEPMPPHPVNKKKVILVVGRFYDQIKRVDRALMVYKYVHALDPTIRMILLGDYKGDMVFPLTNGQSLDHWLSSLQFPMESVEFVGERTDVAPYYREASVLLMPSDCEGFGLSITEAGVAGLPVVTNYYAGCNELVVEGENGYSFESDDYQDAAQKIVNLLHDEVLWQKMSQRAQELAARYTEEAIAEKYQNAFDCILTATDSTEAGQLLAEAGLLMDVVRGKEISSERIAYLEKQLLQAMQGR